MDVYTFVTEGSCEILGGIYLIHSNIWFQKRIYYHTVLFSCFSFKFLYVADRNEGKLKGPDCINISSDPFEAKAKTNNTIHLIETTMANNVFPTSVVNSGTCNLSLHIENYNPK